MFFESLPRTPRTPASTAGIAVEIAPPDPLTAREKDVLAPCLQRRGLTTGMLDSITNIPHRTRLVKVRSAAGELLGLTSVLSTPSIFMKHCFGEGNHIGTNNTFFFSDTDRRADILAAMFARLTQHRRFGYYVGSIDEELTQDFHAALKAVPHVVAHRVMEAGCIATGAADAADRLIRRHGRLSRQVNRFANKGGTVHVHEGTVGRQLAEEFARCCMASYGRHAHPGRRIDVQAYAAHVRSFLTTYPYMVHIYAKLGGRVVGVQNFMRHSRHLELTEGGFLSGEPTYHAYENIIVTSARYAAGQGLENVSYGLITNRAKDRLMDRAGRRPLHFIMFFRNPLVARLMRLYRYRAHRRFPMPYWRDPSAFPAPPGRAGIFTNPH